LELSTTSTDSAASVDGVRLGDLAEELPVGRSSLFELLKALKITTAKGPGADGKGRVAWVSDANAKRLRAAALAVSSGERKIADFSSAISPQTPQTIKRPPSTDASPFLQRLEAAERAVSSGLGLTTAETAWILGVLPGSSPVTRGGITATRTSKNCWKLSRAEM
jgi:hypothetical protein